MKIATHLSANVSTYAQRARFIFLTGKNMAASSELISQIVAHVHTGNHIKPQRVKMCIQMRAGRKGQTTNVVTWGSLDKNWLEEKQRLV